MLLNAPGYPSEGQLIEALSAVLDLGLQPGNGSVRVRNRNPHQGSTFPAEVVECLLPGDRVLRLHCKYEHGRTHKVHGHRGNLSYEASVYRWFILPHKVPTVLFRGSWHDKNTGGTWLFLDHLRARSADYYKYKSAGVIAASAWAGRFHATWQGHFKEDLLLKKYDYRYYRGWVARAANYAASSSPRMKWFRELCQRSTAFIEHLLEAPQTVIHGEYTPGNVLYHRGAAFPIDWESAAVAAGEIDLASLTENWPKSVVQPCERAYRRARWPDGSPAEFRRTLGAARMYWHFRWLGYRKNWTQDPRARFRFEALRHEAERWALI